ncbi:Endonuclease/exonuclease/phosphatase [Coprinopsis sp. MPI-PUGE-AT-0042]|nr:Endonuclease/exonuclease/phosphatase [Coprinopsis sp. MPI-PUGE-AT-0042]
MKDTSVKVPYTGNFSPSTTHTLPNLERGRTASPNSLSEASSSESKTAALKRPPPPPPPPRNSKLQMKRSLSPLPGVPGLPSPLLKPASLPQASGQTESRSAVNSPSVTISPVQTRQRPSRLSALPPPPRHNSLSPNLHTHDTFPLPPPTRTDCTRGHLLRPSVLMLHHPENPLTKKKMNLTPGPQKELLPDSSDSSRRPPELSFRPGPSPRPFVSSPFRLRRSRRPLCVNLEGSDPLPVHNVELKSFGLRILKYHAWNSGRCLNKADRGHLVWMGTKEGRHFWIVGMRPSAHLHCITYILRHGRSMVTLDESGKALIFTPDPAHPEDFVKLWTGKLWTAGKTEHQRVVSDIFNPSAPAKSLLPSEYVGRLTSATILPSRPNCAYVGHEEGFVSIWALDTDDGWPQCYEIMRVSTSDIMSLEGVDSRLWAGGRGGTISAYDVTNHWVAHPGLPVLKMRKLCVVSLGRDECVRFWDGLLGSDWVVLAARRLEPPNHPQNAQFFNEVFGSVSEPPDILAFSFQEVVDLEKRRVMTKSVLLNAAQRKQDALSERVTGNYKRWHDKLVQVVRAAYAPLGLEYEVVHVESLVGLFSCIFVKKTDRFRVRDVMITSIKRGLGGRVLVCRLVVDDSSICFVNCPFGCWPTECEAKERDVTTFIEDKALFKPSLDEVAYVGGGDGTMILDHELFWCWNGDMNYRIDLRREAAISAVRNGDFAVPSQGFHEGLLNFAPTYKYDPYSNEYDSSEKRRVPAWCDRILWRSRTSTFPLTLLPLAMAASKLHYRRYDSVNISDHRPVSAAFQVMVKKVDVEERKRSKRIVEVAWEDEVERRLKGMMEFYVMQALL